MSATASLFDLKVELSRKEEQLKQRIKTTNDGYRKVNKTFEKVNFLKHLKIITIILSRILLKNDQTNFKNLAV